MKTPMLILSGFAGIAMAAPDPHSYANFDQLKVQSMHLELIVDFDKKQLAGSAELKLMRLDEKAQVLKLDTRDLTIEKVERVGARGNQPLRFELGARDAIFGSRLSIYGAGLEHVRIYYRSSPEASGLQWLEPMQTAGKKHPFMFSQSQAIHARSWVPIQDSPAVRFTYSARIKTPKALLARMSADNKPDDALDGDFEFAMPQPIPSYLLAIAVGDLKFAEISERAGVYAEPSVLKKAREEFADTEKMIKATEELYGTYAWGRYDLLILPPSFPFGGMENPRLSFITPTVIAGDKSLVSLIAHELAHSWSGNLVTNRSWDSFWLNEGFTSYVENRIVEAVYGKPQALMEQALSQDKLKRELEELPAADQRLLLDLRGRDPDLGMTAVAYDKGHWFLRFLEQRFGRKAFDAFLKRYFEHFAFSSIASEDFVSFLKRELMAKDSGKLSEEELRTWLEQPGIPDFAEVATSARFAKIDLAIRAYANTEASAVSLNAKRWSVQEWLRFLEGLPSLSAKRLAVLDQAYQLSKSGNSEIAHAFFLQAIKSDYQEVYPALERYLIAIGRRKLVLPLYEALAKSEGGRERAREIYRKARDGYHPITRASIDAVVLPRSQ